MEDARTLISDALPKQEASARSTSKGGVPPDQVMTALPERASRVTESAQISGGGLPTTSEDVKDGSIIPIETGRMRKAHRSKSRILNLAPGRLTPRVTCGPRRARALRAPVRVPGGIEASKAGDRPDRQVDALVMRRDDHSHSGYSLVQTNFSPS